MKERCKIIKELRDSKSKYTRGIEKNCKNSKSGNKHNLMLGKGRKTKPVNET